jgi:hypothetical protein
MTYLIMILLLTMMLSFGTIWFSKNWKFSALTCVMIGAICSVAYFYSLTQRGLPSEASMPERFAVLGVNVKEPDSASKGAIYYWIRPIPSDSDRTPLNIRIPYSKEAHDQAREIQRRMRENRGVQAQRQSQGRGGAEEGTPGNQRPGQGRRSQRSQDGSGSEGSEGEGGDGEGDSRSGLRERIQRALPLPNAPNYQFELVEPDALPPKDGSRESPAPSTRL